MNVQKILIAAVMLLSITNISMASGGVIDFHLSMLLHRQATIYSPQMAEIIRHDNAGISSNTGNLQQEINLINFQDKDFDFPISLIYTGRGFLPRNPDNFVGRDWMLNVGGVVYRTVNGMPDDLESYRSQPEVSRYANNGFLSMLGKKYFDLAEMRQEVKNNPYKYAVFRDLFQSQMMTIPLESGDKNIECSPDIFYFSFGKHSGKFMINYDGSISVVGYNGRKYEVDLGKMKSFGNTYAQNTYICIKTDDGYVYTFGGEGYSSLEYTAFSWKDDNSPKPSETKWHNEINAYYLTKIQAPNGRKLTIHYRDIPEIYHQNPYKLWSLNSEEKKELALQYLLNGKRAIVDDRFRALDAYDINENFPMGSDESSVGTSKYSALTKLVLIDFIETDQGVVRFTYSLRDEHINYGNKLSPDFFEECGPKLDKIDLSMGNRHETVSFKYQYFLGGRMFLTSVKTDMEGIHHFEYNTPFLPDVPTPLTCNIDHWGFWRGNADTKGALIPRIKQSSESSLDFTITSPHRDATGKQVDVSLLTKITYPTGGCAVFSYEPHRYSWIINYYSGTNFYPSLASPQQGQYGIAGGARIHSVKFTDDKGNVQKETLYTYGSALNEGEVLYMPFYKLIYVQKDLNEGGFLQKGAAYNSEGFEYKSNVGVHIRYPHITEHYITSGGVNKKHSYKTIDYMPSLPSSSYLYSDNIYFRIFNEELIGETPLKDLYSLMPQSYYNYVNHLVAHPTQDLTLGLGKIMTEEYYDEDKRLKKRISYRYQYIDTEEYSPCIFTPNLASRLSFSFHTHIGRESFRMFLPSEQEVTTWEERGQNSFKQEKELYKYDKYGYLLCHTHIYNDKDSVITENSYREHRSSIGFQILPENKKIYQVTDRKKQLLRSETQSYQFPIYTYDKNYWDVLSEVYYFDGENSQMIGSEECDYHDGYGNPLEVTKNGIQSTAYLYGHNGQYLMAKIENSTYHEVSSALGMRAELVSEKSDPTALIEKLREKLPHAQIYSYSYLWGIGLKSETKPDGTTTFYNYDKKGRLILIWRKDEKGNPEILKHYDYHIVNE